MLGVDELILEELVILDVEELDRELELLEKLDELEELDRDELLFELIEDVELKEDVLDEDDRLL